MTENKKSTPKKTTTSKTAAKKPAAKKKSSATKKPEAKISINDSAASLRSALGDSQKSTNGAVVASTNVGSYSSSSWLKKFFKKLLG